MGRTNLVLTTNAHVTKVRYFYITNNERTVIREFSFIVKKMKVVVIYDGLSLFHQLSSPQSTFN